MTSYVELFEVKKTYPGPGAGTVVVEDFELKMQKGEFVSLIGHSGCGKSTVLSMIAGLNTLTSGVIVVAGREVREPGPDRAVVFQAPCLLPWLSALDNVLLGVSRVFERETKRERRDRAVAGSPDARATRAINRQPPSRGTRRRARTSRRLPGFDCHARRNRAACAPPRALRARNAATIR